MASAPQSVMLNQSLFEEQDYMLISSSQLGMINFPFHYTNFASLPPLGGCTSSSQLLLSPLQKTLISNDDININPPPNSLASDDHSSGGNLTLSDHSKQKEEDLTAHQFAAQILSLQKPSSNYWAWGELNDCMSTKRSDQRDDQYHHLGVTAMKMKKIKGRRKVREPRFCFKTMSDVDVLDDGYKWRKYGQKVVKNTQHPRSYYRCTQENCRVKKRVERLADDPRMVITSYEGRHAHSPSHDDDDSQSNNNSAQLNNFFW